MKFELTIRSKNPPFHAINGIEGVRMNLMGDMSDLDNVISELKEIKSFANSQTNKAGLALRDVKLIIHFIG